MHEVPRLSRSLRAFTCLGRKKNLLKSNPNDLSKKRLRHASATENKYGDFCFCI